MTQLAIVIIIVALAIAYAVYRIYHAVKNGPSCNCGNCNGCSTQGCGKRSSQFDRNETTEIQ